MYAIVDRPLGDIDQGGRFLVMAMRGWVLAMHGRKCPASSLAPSFAACRLLSGLQPFLRMMAVFNRHGLENMAFGGCDCTQVSEHEAIIVTLVRSVRHGQPMHVAETLERLVEDEAVGEGLIAISALAAAMAAAPLFARQSTGFAERGQELK